MPLPNTITLKPSQLHTGTMASSRAFPIRYFTLAPEDYDTITDWLRSNELDYERFFASFINFRK